MVTIDATQAARFFVGGQVTAKVTLYEPPGLATNVAASTHRKFPLISTHSTLRTVPGAMAAILLLFLLAYVKSAIYWLVHGQRRAFETTNLFIGGALAGITAVLIAWLFGGPEPAMRGLVVCAMLGAAAGVCTAVASLRFTQRQEANDGPAAAPT